MYELGLLPSFAKCIKSSRRQVSWLLDLILTSAYLPRMPFMACRNSDDLSWFGLHQLQWRDRAGISPASLFSSDLSEPPTGII